MYNYKEIRDKVYNIAKEACYAPTNVWKETAWTHHVLPVVEHSISLGKKMKADLEVLEIAALLHDHAGIVDMKKYKNHHVEGAKMAKDILFEINFPENKIEKVAQCIYEHRGSVLKEKNNLESKILASADAMSHFTELADMFLLAFGVHKYSTSEGCEWLKGKLDRSWKKIIPEGQKLIEDDYKIAMKIVTKGIN
jgi:uncharacterized protein